MRFLPTLIPTVLLGAIGICSGGCSSTELVNSWAKPGGVPQPFRKVVVMAALQREDLRRCIEDEFVRQLAARGVQAIPGYTLVPEPGEHNPEKVKREVEKTGADAVLLSGLGDADSFFLDTFPDLSGLSFLQINLP